MTVGKALGHCTQHEWAAKEYGVEAWTVVLWDKKGQPRASVTFDFDPTKHRSGAPNSVVEESSRRFQNAPVEHTDPEGPATEALVRYVLGPPSAEWGEALTAINPKNVKPAERVHLATWALEEVEESKRWMQTFQRSLLAQPTAQVKGNHLIVEARRRRPQSWDWAEQEAETLYEVFGALRDEWMETIVAIATEEDLHPDDSEVRLILFDESGEFFVGPKESGVTSWTVDDEHYVQVKVDLTKKLYFPAEEMVDLLKEVVQAMEANIEWWEGDAYASALYTAIEAALTQRHNKATGRATRRRTAPRKRGR